MPVRWAAALLDAAESAALRWSGYLTAPRPGKFARGADQLVDDAGLGHGVAGVADDAQVDLRPGAG